MKAKVLVILAMALLSVHAGLGDPSQCYISECNIHRDRDQREPSAGGPHGPC